LKRFAVGIAISSAFRTSQPLLLAGEAIQPCTSATRALVDDHVYEPTPEIWRVALAVAANSPPCVVHGIPGWKRLIHVASFGVAMAPAPSPLDAFDVPSPQLSISRCSSTFSRPAFDFDM
jgi:hypothetical protein